MDQARSYHLCVKALEFAEKVLKQGGNIVLKIFEGEDFPALREALKERFANIKTFSPPASRKESSEVYLVGLGYQGGGGRLTEPTPKREETEAWWEETDDA
jgi:23S rRNA (uridine2552-2'-O)-methyltransferase